MRLLRAVAVAFVFSLVVVSAAKAASYYVATTGSDTASGSIDAPFRTIGKAAEVAQPGDVVNVRGGVYGERTTISSRGTAAAPIVFRSMPGETAILDGTGHAAGTDLVTLLRTEHVDFSGFEVRNATKIGIVLWLARNTRVLDNHVHHTVRNGIYAGGDVAISCYDITVSGNSVHDTVRENEFHAMNRGGWAGAIVVSRTERATISRNRVWNNDGEGIISLRSNHHVIEGNEIADNFSVNLYFDNSRFGRANGNLITSTNPRYFRDGYPAAGISVANETTSVMNPSSDNVFSNNIVVGTKWGFYYGNYESGGGLRNTQIVNNTFYGTTNEIIRIDDDAHVNSTVANNVFYQTGSPAPARVGMGIVRYQNNLWYGGTAGAAASLSDIIGDPRVVNPGGRAASDYRLTAVSPAIASGAGMNSVSADFWGTPRAATFDIGAHQFSAGAPPVPDTQAPTAPANFSATASANTTRIALAWTAATDNVGVTGYRVYRNGALVATINATTWNDASALGWSTTYTYAVTAVDAAGNVSPQAVASATTPAAPPTPDTQAPTVPTGFWVNPSSSSTRMYLGWTASTDNVAVTGYRIYRNGDYITTVTGTTWTDESELRRKTRYVYAVTAIDAAGNESGRTTEAARTSR